MDWISRVQATRLGKRLSKKQVQKLADRYGQERLILALEVLDFSQGDALMEVRNAFGYVRQVLEEGLDVPAEFWRAKVWKRLREVLPEARRKYHERQAEIERHWQNLEVPLRRDWLLTVSQKVLKLPVEDFEGLKGIVAEMYRPGSVEEKRLKNAIGLLAMVMAFERFEELKMALAQTGGKR